MTHQNIYTKFMIEYDKANVTSSYPSLTEYEVATVLDKAYNALIAQKVTGNNVRRATFESDIKSIADLGPLTKTANRDLNDNKKVAPNVVYCSAPEDMLYFLQATMWDKGESINNYDRFQGEYNPIDGINERKVLVKLVDHQTAQKFFSSSSNIPWIKNPVCYLEDKNVYVAYDPLSTPIIKKSTETSVGGIDILYIRKPNLFVKDLLKFEIPEGSQVSYFQYSSLLEKQHITNDENSMTYEQRYTFECNDTVAEELISLAVAFALENVESLRLNSKLNMRGLEA